MTNLDGEIIGITGRTFDDWRPGPRYYTEAKEATLYLPRPLNHHHRLGIITEGPMDALRVADATTRRRHLLVISLCGLGGVTGARRRQLSRIARSVSSFVFAPDASVPVASAIRMMAELRTVPALGRLTRLAMPPGFDDPGEMSATAVVRWLSTI